MREFINLVEAAFRMDGGYHYVTNCTSGMHGPYGEAISDMVDAATDLTYAQMEKAVGRDELAEVFPDYDWSPRPKGLTLKKDWAVSYHKSEWLGINCVYVRHSAIEYIFTRGGQRPRHDHDKPEED